MATKEQLNAVGMNCPGFARDDSLYSTINLKDVLSQGERSCAVCKQWDVGKQKCRINLFDQVLTGLDQT